VCGRYALSTPSADLKTHFDLDEVVALTPRYNIPPGTDIPVIRQSPEHKRVLHLLRWGLVPHWAGNPDIGKRLNNARAESVAEKPAFRDAFKRRRCLVPADGFYEWKTEGAHKLPYFISHASGQPLALGGVWESWRGPGGEILRTVCLITTGPNALMAPIHDRMPVIVPQQDWGRWLAGQAADVTDLIRPSQDSGLQAWPVDRRVSRTSEDEVSLTRPLPT